MKRMLGMLFVMGLLMSNPAAGFTLSGTITGGQGLPLRYVFAVPASLDTFYVTIAIPFINTYTFNAMEDGGYLLFAYQDLNTNITPDLDEPRGFYGGEIPEVFQLVSDTSGVIIELTPPNQGGFSGTISYAGTRTGTTLLLAYYTPDFQDLPHGAGVLLSASGNGNGNFIALVDSFTTYYAYAFMDLNGSLAWDPGEPRGVYGGTTPDPIVVEELNYPDDISITMEETSSADDPNTAVSHQFSLHPIYPNPFNSTASVSFTIGAPETVDLSLFNLLGRKVLTVAQGNYSAGEHRAELRADDLPTGLYFMRLSGQAGMAIQRVVLIR